MATTVQNGSVMDAATWGGSLPAESDAAAIQHTCTGPTGNLDCQLSIAGDGASLTVTGTLRIQTLVSSSRTIAGGCAVTVASGGHLHITSSATASNGGAASGETEGTDADALILVQSGGQLTVEGPVTAGNGGAAENGGGAGAMTPGSQGSPGGDGGTAITVDGAATVTIGGGVTAGSGGAAGNGSGGYADETPENSAAGGQGGTGGAGGYGVLLTSTSSGELSITGAVAGGNAASGGNGGAEGNYGDTNYASGGTGGTGGNGATAVYQDSSSDTDITIAGTVSSGTDGTVGSTGYGSYYPGSAGSAGTRGAGMTSAGYDDDLSAYNPKTGSVLIAAISAADVKKDATIYPTVTGGAYILGTYDPQASEVWPDEANVSTTETAWGPAGDDYAGELDITAFNPKTTSALIAAISESDVKKDATIYPTVTGGAYVLGTYDPMASAVFPSEANTSTAETAYGPTGAEYAGELDLGAYNQKTTSALIAAISESDVKKDATIYPTVTGGAYVLGTYDPMSAAVFPTEANVSTAETAFGPTGAEYAGELDLGAYNPKTTSTLISAISADDVKVAVEIHPTVTGGSYVLGTFTHTEDYQGKTESTLISAISAADVKKDVEIYPTVTGGSYVLGTYDPMAAAVFPEESKVDISVTAYGPVGDDYAGELDVTAMNPKTTSTLISAISADDVKVDVEIHPTVTGGAYVLGTFTHTSDYQGKTESVLISAISAADVKVAVEIHPTVTGGAYILGTFTHTSDYQGKTESALIAAISASDVKKDATIYPTVTGGAYVLGTYDPVADCVFPAEGNTTTDETAYGPTGVEYAGSLNLDNLLAENVKNGVQIDSVTGTYIGSGAGGIYGML